MASGKDVSAENHDEGDDDTDDLKHKLTLTLALERTTRLTKLLVDSGSRRDEPRYLLPI